MTATADALAAATFEAQAMATAEAMLPRLSTLDNTGPPVRVYGPTEGLLEHKDDNLVKLVRTQVRLRDFVVEVAFYNPYSRAEGPWDCGILFRESGQGGEMLLIMDSNGEWVLKNRTAEGASNRIQGGTLPGLEMDEGQANRIWLAAYGNRGLLYVNDVFVSELDLTSRLSAGNIIAAIGLYEGDEIAGKSTRYTHFSVWSLP
jgi:hypothetical protein